MRSPAFFLGGGRKDRYFEGWYFKCISRDRRHAVALIPGMAITPMGGKNAFVQVIHAETGKTYYFEYPYEAFRASADHFEVQVGANHFTADGFSVALSQPGVGTMSGTLRFSECHPYPTSPFHPGIMGPFSFVPDMECNHVILHLSHRLHGTLTLDGTCLDFEGGAGYIEKDYGRSFPRHYVWIQASHFDQGEACLVFSRARIPMLGTHFPGFFAYFTDFSGIQARFATYNLSRLSLWEVDPATGTCRAAITGPAGRLSFEAAMTRGGTLRAPVDGLMDREIIESIGARVTVTLADLRGNVRYHGSSGEAGMEISL